MGKPVDGRPVTKSAPNDYRLVTPTRAPGFDRAGRPEEDGESKVAERRELRRDASRTDTCSAAHR